MKKYKLLSFVLFCLLIMGCKFPDEVPNIYALQTYKLKNLNFGKTTVKSFEILTKYKAASRLGNMIIFDSIINNDKYFNKARVGFVNNKMDWIEFKFVEKVSVSEILKLYGKPISINKKYSRELDYYEYGDFSLALPKEQEYFVTLNLFNLPNNSLKNKSDILKTEDPRVDFESLDVGKTLESDFKDLYPTLEPSLSLTRTEYIFKGKLTSNPMIKQISLKFDSGLLNWAAISPLAGFTPECLNTLKDEKFTIEKKQKYDFYIYKNVIVTLTKDKKIINIGILDGKISPFLKLKTIKR